MLKNKVFFLIFSKSTTLLNDIPEIIIQNHSTPEISTFKNSTLLFNEFKEPIHFLRVVILDLEYEEEVFDFLNNLKTLETSTSLICGFSKEKNPELSKKFFINNGNIFFNCDSLQNPCTASIQKLIKTIKKFQLVTVNPNHLIMDLT